MAAYVKTTGMLPGLKRVMEIWNNTINEQMIQEILVILNTEFAAAETAGLAVYTVTSGLQDSMDNRLNNISNNTMRLQMIDFTTQMSAEFAAVAAGDLAYTVTTNLKQLLQRTISNWPNSTHKIGLFQMIDIFMTDFDLMEAAS